MDYFGLAVPSIREIALRKLAKNSVQTVKEVHDNTAGEKHDNFSKLLSYVRTENVTVSEKEINIKKFEALCALGDAAPYVKDKKKALVLLEELQGHLHELENLRFGPMVVKQTDGGQKWHILAQKLTYGIAHLGSGFDYAFAADVLRTFDVFLKNLFSREFDSSLYFILLGFIDGLVLHPLILVYNADALSLFRELYNKTHNHDFLLKMEQFTSGSGNGSNDFLNFLRRDFSSEVSPIVYLERVSKLMCAMISSLTGCGKTSLLNYLLKESVKDVKGGEKKELADAPCISIPEFHLTVVKTLSKLAIENMDTLDKGQSYIVYSSFERLKKGYLAKSHNIEVIGSGLYFDVVDMHDVNAILKSCYAIEDSMLDRTLGSRALELGSLLVYKNSNAISSLTRAFSSLLSNPKLEKEYCQEASKTFGLACKLMSADVVITSIYAFSNILFVGNDGLQARNSIKRSIQLAKTENFTIKESHSNISANNSINFGSHLNGNANFNRNGELGKTVNKEESKIISKNAITAIVEIVQVCGDETVSTLAVTILSQRATQLDSNIGKIALRGVVSCAPYLPEQEFIIITKLLNNLSLDALEKKSENVSNALLKARVELSRNIKENRALFMLHLKGILQVIISRGDVQALEHHRSHNEISVVGDQIGIFLEPLAELLPNYAAGEKPLEITDIEIVNLFRNIWFNMVVHGYSTNSNNAKKYNELLKRIAYNTPPLASELNWDRTETSLELNTVLKRGSSNHNVKDHRHIIGDILDLQRISYPKLMFLSATVFLESLRVKTGNCSKILYYYSDPSLKTSGVEKYIDPIATRIVSDFLVSVNNRKLASFDLDHIAEQLTTMLSFCCYRLNDLQEVALKCCDILITRIPSSLTRQRSLFTLFDLLTVLFQSIIDAEEHQYEPTTSYITKRTGIPISLSDSYEWRKQTFSKLYDISKKWMQILLFKCSVDVKTLIQLYVSYFDDFQPDDEIQFGVSFALETAGSLSGTKRELAGISEKFSQNINTLPKFVTELGWRNRYITNVVQNGEIYNECPLQTIGKFRTRALELEESLRENKNKVKDDEVINFLGECAGVALISDENIAELTRYMTSIPFVAFKSRIMSAAVDTWLAFMKDRPDASVLLLSEVAKKWETSIQMKYGLFSRSHDLNYPEFSYMEYSPSDQKLVCRIANAVGMSFEPHLRIIQLFASHFEATLYQSNSLLMLITKFVELGLRAIPFASLHPYARLSRFELIRFSFDVLNYHIKLSTRKVNTLVKLIIEAILSWFYKRHFYPFGQNILKVRAEYSLLQEVLRLIVRTDVGSDRTLRQKKELAIHFLTDEVTHISVWLNPLKPPHVKTSKMGVSVSLDTLKVAYGIDPILAINLQRRYNVKDGDSTLQRLITHNPLPAIWYPEAVQYYTGVDDVGQDPSYYLLFWEPLSPIDAIRMFLPPLGSNSYVLQYTMRSIEYHDVNLTFFYVPQIVQCLRFDAKGYVERFIIETAKTSQLFAHQIIWNILANSYKDEEGTEPDELKPVFDRIQEKMLKEFSERDLSFYKKEFAFFNEVTEISGKLKPYIKKSKAEKKLKIDQEIAKIDVQEGVYLPSNPDGVVVDINRKSGKPLQSHAKAPFMASFKIRKDVTDINDSGEPVKYLVEKWQSAIFKVGDDCRQDVLALQLISIFRTIWANAGLDLYVFPYRVTATAPGCGVIDVLPNSVSRDMLGREAVNGLYEYFTTKFGPESSPEFQKARNNFIKSLAGYSIISYLLQFKDRHNGNIMYNSEGRILHVDFGFCFDIVPGGVKFEAAPFKLTHEMVMVLGGSANTQAFQWFEELCVKGFLACRPYMETIVRSVTPMLSSGLPCFKPATIRKLRSRFVPTKSDRDASLFMRSLVKKSMESFYTKGYDEFQRLTNGIPY